MMETHAVVVQAPRINDSQLGWTVWGFLRLRVIELPPEDGEEIGLFEALVSQ